MIICLIVSLMLWCRHFLYWFIVIPSPLTDQVLELGFILITPSLPVQVCTVQMCTGGQVNEGPPPLTGLPQPPVISLRYISNLAYL